MHELLAQHTYEEMWDDHFYPQYGGECVGLYVPDYELRIIGTYYNQCGGGDWFLAGRGGSKKTMEMLSNMIDRLYRDWHPRHLLIEGFMISGTFGRWHDMAVRHTEEFGQDPWKFLCLDTPLDLCIQRIIHRREERGDYRPFNPVNVTKHFAQVLNTRNTLERLGHCVIDIDHRRSAEQFVEILDADRVHSQSV